MVLPDDILEAVDALPLEESWDLIRSYLDEGGDIDDLSADGITILNHFLKDFEWMTKLVSDLSDFCWNEALT